MILYGAPVANKIYLEIKDKMKGLTKKPALGVILVGENKASLTYVKKKEEISEKFGFEFKLFHLSELATERQVITLIEDINKNKYIDGIILQLPLPEGLNRDKIISKISPHKDVDGFLGKIPAPTPSAIIELLNYYKIDYKKKKICIVGKGFLVGAPLEKMLKKEGLDPVVIKSNTENKNEKILKAEIIISATGISGIIKPELVNKNTILIDAGTSESNGKTKGDIDSDIYNIVDSYSPVPGGIGPVTVACLVRNLAELAQKN